MTPAPKLINQKQALYSCSVASPPEVPSGKFAPGYLLPACEHLPQSPERPNKVEQAKPS